MKLLDEIQTRADAATEGPWRIEKDREEDYEQGIPYSEWPQTLIGPANAFPSQWSKDHGTTHQVDEISELTFPDAEFIAHAREDVPKLVAALRAVEAAMDDLDEARNIGTIVTYGQVQRSVRDAIRDALA